MPQKFFVNSTDRHSESQATKRGLVEKFVGKRTYELSKTNFEKALLKQCAEEVNEEFRRFNDFDVRLYDLLKKSKHDVRLEHLKFKPHTDSSTDTDDSEC